MHKGSVAELHGLLLTLRNLERHRSSGVQTCGMAIPRGVPRRRRSKLTVSKARNWPPPVSPVPEGGVDGDR
eukprot:13919543-Alexandrium_andersonii.AAC.1